jgi:hypothetical protein
MTDERFNFLLDAVDDLTKPIVEHLTQKEDNGTYIRTHTAEHLPLLEQLRDAVNPSSNSAAGSASLKSTRNLIDGDALYRYALMTSAVGDWCNMLKVTRSRNPVTDLRRWYVAYAATGADGKWYVSELSRWAFQIRNLIEPPKRFELTIACPVCRSSTWLDADGARIPHPLIVEYKVPADGASIKPKAMCRAEGCEAVWVGYEAVEELSEELAENSLQNRTTTV